MAHYHGLCSFVLGQGLTEDSQRVLEAIQMQKTGSGTEPPSQYSSPARRFEEVSDADSYCINALKSQSKYKDDDLSFDEDDDTMHYESS